MEYLVPADLAEAVRMRAGGTAVLAGGTDVYPAHVGRPFEGPLVDIGGLDELRGISETPEGYRLGALTRWVDVIAAPLPSGFDGLRAAAREVGSVQVQAAGTIGGNLCTASPAADGMPPLLTLDASVELRVGGRHPRARARGLRHGVPADGAGARRAGDGGADPARGGRGALDVRQARAAPVPGDLDRDGGRGDRRGAGRHGRAGADRRRGLLPVARRLRDLEAELVGRSVDEDLGALARSEHLASLAPIDDVRATAEYRRDAALTLVRRAVTRCAGRPGYADAL